MATKPVSKTSTPDPKHYTANRVADEARLEAQAKSEPKGEPRPKSPQRGQAQSWAPAPKAVPVTKPAAAKGKK